MDQTTQSHHRRPSQGTLVPRTRRIAGICLVLLLIATFPANVSAALNEVQIRGEAATPLWLRAPMQLLFIGLVWLTSIKRPSREERRSRVRGPVVEQERTLPREGASS
jgi:uncharacterized membrane protein